MGPRFSFLLEPLLPFWFYGCRGGALALALQRVLNEPSLFWPRRAPASQEMPIRIADTKKTLQRLRFNIEKNLQYEKGVSRVL